MIELSGKFIIITDGAMGMGAATAELMAVAGGKIVIADFNEELGRQQTQKIIDAGVQQPLSKPMFLRVKMWRRWFSSR